VRFVVAFACVTAVAASAGAAPTKVQCVQADTNGQTLRQAGKLHAARDAFRSCADPACPAIVRADCNTRLDEVARVTPSLVLEAHDASGDLADVVVTLDGAPLVDRLSGTPVEIDPGSHTLVFTAQGHAPITRALVVSEGEQARRVSVAFESAPGPEAPGPTAGSSGGGTRLAGIVIGSVGIVGLGLGAAFGAAAFAAWSSVPAECPQATGCTDVNAYNQAVSSHDTASAFATASDVALVAGGVLLATGVVVYFLAPHAKRSAAAIAPWLGPGGGGLVLRDAF